MLHRKLTSENRAKRGSLIHRPVFRMFGPELAFAKFGPGNASRSAGPRSDAMRFITRCVSCSRRRCGRLGSVAAPGAPSRRSGTGSSCELRFTVAAHGPLPAVHESMPVAQAGHFRIFGTCPVEACSSVKIALRSDGLRPPLLPSPPDLFSTPEHVEVRPRRSCPKSFHRSRGKHHAKASRLRVWKQIAGGSSVAQG